MFCINCGAHLNDGSKFCNQCGAQQSSTQQSNQQADFGQQNNQQTSWEQQQEWQRQQNWQRYQQEHPEYQQQNPSNNQYDMPMKWHKFIIYFQLFCGMAINLWAAVSSFTGEMYGEYKNAFYLTYPAFKTIDIAYGVLCLLLIPFAVIVRQKLANFKQNGPALYISFLAVNLVISIAYIVAMITITNVDISELNISTYITSFCTSFCMIAVNSIYFNKRRHLFTK